MKNFTLVVFAAFCVFSIAKASSAWFPDFFDFFSADEDSSELSATSNLDISDVQNYTPQSEKSLPVLTEERKAELSKFYSRLGCDKSYDPNLRAYKPVNKEEWLFVMEYFSKHWDFRLNVKKFTAEDVKSFERMKELTMLGDLDSNDKRSISLAGVYMEDLCNIAEVDSEAAIVMDSLTLLVPSSCLAVCASKKLQAQMNGDDKQYMLDKAISCPALTDDQISFYWSDFFLETNSFSLRDAVITAIEYKRFKLFKTLVSLYCARIQPFASNCCKIVALVADLFNLLHHLKKSTFLQPFDALQLNMLDILIESIGRVDFAALVQFRPFVEQYTRFDSQLKNRLFEYLDKANTANLEQLDNFDYYEESDSDESSDAESVELNNLNNDEIEIG